MKRNAVRRDPSDKRRLERYRHSRNIETFPPSGPDSLRGRRRRLFTIVLAAVLIAGGVYTLGRGELAYHNYWGGTVFAPFAIAIGVLLLLLALFRWPRLDRIRTGTDGGSGTRPGSRSIWWRS